MDTSRVTRYASPIVSRLKVRDNKPTDQQIGNAMSMEAACAELIREKEKQFDPVIVDALLKIIKNGTLK